MAFFSCGSKTIKITQTLAKSLRPRVAGNISFALELVTFSFFVFPVSTFSSANPVAGSHGDELWFAGARTAPGSIPVRFISASVLESGCVPYTPASLRGWAIRCRDAKEAQV